MGVEDSLPGRVARHRNDFSGTAANVAQVGALYGDLIFAGDPSATAKARDFEYRYRAGLAAGLDRMELFGLDVTWNRRVYSLSQSYIDLSVEVATGPLAGTRRIEEVLTSRRVLLEGAAGTGKTTLLRHLALAALRGRLPLGIGESAHPIPFLLKLRSFVTDDELTLPEVEDFLSAVAPPLVAEKPSGWVSGLLGGGNALVLVDGADEVRPDHRPSVLAWLRDLVTFYGRAGYVLTSRPAALADDWRDELLALGFTTARLTPMTRPQVDELVDRWHGLRPRSRPAQHQLTIDGEDAGHEKEPAGVMRELAESLKQQLTRRKDLARLATSPVLCAVLCTLNEVWGSLPDTRAELYRTAIDLLLTRRDTARRIRLDWQIGSGLSRLALSRFAQWMIMGGQDAIPMATAVRLIRDIADDPALVMSRVLEQTGLIQEVGDGLLEFRFSSFQDYLAAEEFLRQDLHHHLVLDAHHPSYREVVITAAELPGGRDRLLSGIVDRAETDRTHERELWFLAAACLAQAARAPVELAARIGEAVERLLPPANLAEAEHVAQAGVAVLDMLVRAADRREPTDVEAAASIRAATLIDADSATPLLRRFRHRAATEVQGELASGWFRAAEPERYADLVLADAALQDTWLDLQSTDLLPYLGRLHHLRALRLPPRADTETLERLAEIESVRERLHSLDLAGTDIVDVRPLASFPRLRSVDVSGTKVTDLSPLGGRPGLTIRS